MPRTKPNSLCFVSSQYADDTSLTLEDDPVSLERCVHIFDKFGDCGGLRANLDKTQAVWFGSGHGCGPLMFLWGDLVKQRELV
jgi:hypothetical protein